jgi:hypothetical protein
MLRDLVGKIEWCFSINVAKSITITLAVVQTPSEPVFLLTFTQRLHFFLCSMISYFPAFTWTVRSRPGDNTEQRPHHSDWRQKRNYCTVLHGAKVKRNHTWRCGGGGWGWQVKSTPAVGPPTLGKWIVILPLHTIYRRLWDWLVSEAVGWSLQFTRGVKWGHSRSVQ